MNGESEDLLMRCGCPECGAFMIHSESSNDCVCPDCLYRCHACQGTGTAISREEALHLREIMGGLGAAEKENQQEQKQE